MYSSFPCTRARIVVTFNCCPFCFLSVCIFNRYLFCIYVRSCSRRVSLWSRQTRLKSPNSFTFDRSKTVFLLWVLFIFVCPFSIKRQFRFINVSCHSNLIHCLDRAVFYDYDLSWAPPILYYFHMAIFKITKHKNMTIIFISLQNNIQRTC